ncbi:MAG: hypothetical protein Unbinned8622contig1003_47 [Prokaryotic dsDNA virus sp.]|nr:MAG: hypothetical protein Unbinned8622contig1003_47 [Prokaryotic dsDNA virus sp.]|tara:strand:- start:15653 stop:16684 length:1032 start_codon:yes stop_codon:yes gene_type:complete
MSFFQDLFTGGAYSRNKQAEKQADAANEANEEAREFAEEEAKRRYEYDKEGLQILKKNTEDNLRFQEAERNQQYSFGMGIRAFNFHRENLAFAQSKATRDANLAFNDIAAGFAGLQQDRFLMEQQVELELDEKQTMLNYAVASHGLQLKKQRTKSAAAEQMRKTGITGLKAKGQALARGQAGRSAGKTIQGIMAEVDAAENDLINTLMSDTAQIDLDLLVASQQNLMDKLAFDLRENNLVAADSLTRTQIKMQRVQADLQAEANMMLKPELAPPLPKPIALPRPEFQEIYEPRVGPGAATVIPQRESLVMAGLNTAIGAAKFVGAGTSGFTQAFNLGKAFGFS